jgi:hypothetical protein
MYSKLGESYATDFLMEAVTGIPGGKGYHARATHEMLGPTLVDRIRRFVPPAKFMASALLRLAKPENRK